MKNNKIIKIIYQCQILYENEYIYKYMKKNGQKKIYQILFIWKMTKIKNKVRKKKKKKKNQSRTTFLSLYMPTTDHVRDT